MKTHSQLQNRKQSVQYSVVKLLLCHWFFDIGLIIDFFTSVLVNFHPCASTQVAAMGYITHGKDVTRPGL